MRSHAGLHTHSYPDDPRRQVRVVRYLEGTLRRHAPWQAGLAAQTGHLAARLDLALASFHHPGCGQSLLWDLRRAPELEPLRIHLRGDPLAATVDDALDENLANIERRTTLPPDGGSDWDAGRAARRCKVHFTGRLLFSLAIGSQHAKALTPS